MSQLSCFSLPIVVSYFPAFLLFHISFPFQGAPSFNFFFLHFCCDFSCTHPCFICCLSGFSFYIFSYKFSSLKGFLLAFSKSDSLKFERLLPLNLVIVRSHSKWKYLLYPIFVIGVHASARERRDDDHIIQEKLKYDSAFVLAKHLVHCLVDEGTYSEKDNTSNSCLSSLVYVHQFAHPSFNSCFTS